MPEITNEKALELLTALRDEAGHAVTPDDKIALTLVISLLESQASEAK